MTSRRLPRRQSLAQVPVMMLTADANRQTVVAALKAGVNDYFIKTSLSRPELLKKVRRLVAVDAGEAQSAAHATAT